VILRHAFIPPDNARLAHLCGSFDEHLQAIEAGLDVKISRRNESFRIEGPKQRAQQAVALLQSLYGRARRPISPERLQLALVEAAAQPTAKGEGGADGDASGGEPGEISLRTRRADLTGRTPNQLAYLRNILGHDITFGIGPAGTGKTYLAVACAVDALERSTVPARDPDPACGRGRRAPRLPAGRPRAESRSVSAAPLRRALRPDGLEKVGKAFEKGTLEIAPLAFMRGRTLNHAFVILDEAQNTTPEQMKMFLTRIGFGSKAVVTGDVSQIDLPRGSSSGLIDAERVLRRVRGIATTHFTSADVVRHPLVAHIVEAYDAARRQTD
jgi:phosphate starvation-inducible PhoH-like protein